MPVLAEARHFWIHDLDPFIVRFSGNFGIRWYGLSYVLGILLAVWILNRWVRARRVPLSPGESADFALYVGLGMVLGGRMGYCLLYHTQGFFADPLYFFRIWEGGMASHGGIVGMAVGTLLFALRRGRSFWVLADQVSALAPLGVILGRLANFVNGELWGRPARVDWAILFPKAEPVDPALVPWASELGCRTVQDKPAWVEWVGSARENWDFSWYFVPRHPSQLYAAVLEGLLPFLILLFIHKRHRKPGLTVGACFILYGIGRFVDEFWREPDLGYNLYFGWMSKGQLFTVPLFLFGVLLVAITAIRAARPDAYRVPEEKPVKSKDGKKPGRK